MCRRRIGNRGNLPPNLGGTASPLQPLALLSPGEVPPTAKTAGMDRAKTVPPPSRLMQARRGQSRRRRFTLVSGGCHCAEAGAHCSSQGGRGRGYVEAVCLELVPNVC